MCCATESRNSLVILIIFQYIPSVQRKKLPLYHFLTRNFKNIAKKACSVFRQVVVVTFINIPSRYITNKYIWPCYVHGAAPYCAAVMYTYTLDTCCPMQFMKCGFRLGKLLHLQLISQELLKINSTAIQMEL